MPCYFRRRVGASRDGTEDPLTHLLEPVSASTDGVVADCGRGYFRVAPAVTLLDLDTHDIPDISFTVEFPSSRLSRLDDNNKQKKNLEKVFLR